MFHAIVVVVLITGQVVIGADSKYRFDEYADCRLRSWVLMRDAARRFPAIAIFPGCQDARITERRKQRESGEDT